MVVNEAQAPRLWQSTPSMMVSLVPNGRKLDCNSHQMAVVLAAMVNWVENGQAPTEFVAAKYTNNNVTQGVQFTRKLCPVSCVGIKSYLEH